MERILVGIDGSGPSLKAVDFAADLASKYNAELIVLTVAPQFPSEVDPAIEEYARLEHITSPATELVVTTADNLLDNARKRAEAKGATRILAERCFGNSAQEIIATAKNRQTDLIVVGSRGHGRLIGLLLGSVAQKVISLAHCPVVVVR
jgi:nucleotide-binding universal stress UspA family protein